MTSIWSCRPPGTKWVSSAVWVVVGVALASRATTMCAAETSSDLDTVQSLIQKAGNTDDDRDRLALLKQLREHPGLDESLKTDLDHLIVEADRWINDKSLIYFHIPICHNGDYDFKIASDSPFYPLAQVYRSRMLLWFIREYGGWLGTPKGDAYLDKGRESLKQAIEAFPENRIIRMYLGEPIPPHKHYYPVPGAPEWAVYQREGLERLTDIVDWWIDHRLQENGEYGGAWDDDCEMWRWWSPVMIGFDSPKITQAQTFFSNAVMNLPNMKLGYSIYKTDVEHSSEYSSDTITPMMHLDPDNDIWGQRALRVAELMKTLWAGRNERGFLQFKSLFFSADKVDVRPEKWCDTVYHTSAVQPALLYWQRTGEAELTALFSDWMDTWVDAAARSERGKPAGILPSAIRWPDGAIGGVGANWWEPKSYSTRMFDWPSAMQQMMQTLLLTHHMTGQDKYLDPIRSMARIRLNYLKNPPTEPPVPGSEAWCASKLVGTTGMTSAIAKYKLLTQSTEFDELLNKDLPPYARLRLRGEIDPLVLALRNNAAALRINFEGYTSEVRFTDRVLTCSQIVKLAVAERIATIRNPDPALLYSTVTGDPGKVDFFPMNAVRWLTPPREIAALVTDSGTDLFRAELFHFGNQKRPMSAELYLLTPGDYTLTLVTGNTKEQTPLITEEFAVEGPRTRVAFELPPRELCFLDVRRK